MSIQFKSHQRSWWFVHTQPTQKALSPGPESHQRSWWMVHIQPVFDQSQSESDRRVRLGMNNPPTALVGLLTIRLRGVASLFQHPARRFLLSDQEDIEGPATKLLVSCAIHFRTIPEYVPITVVASRFVIIEINCINAERR